MNFRRYCNILISSSFIVLFSQSYGFSGSCSVNDYSWMNKHKEAKDKLLQTVDSAGQNIIRQNTLNTQAILSALKVHAKQNELDGQRRSTMTRDAQQGEASVYTEQTKNEAILKAQEQFSKRGLSVDPCGSANLISKALSQILPDNNTSIIALTDVAAGKATPIEEVLKNRIQNTNENNLKIETFLKGGDKDAAMFLSNASGLPLPKNIKTDTPLQNKLNFIQARRAEALRSAALTSMEAVRNAYKPDGAIAGYDTLINQYGGGEGYDKWQKELATKNERGLQQEFAKLRAISMRLEQASLQSESRTAVIMGVLLAGETGAGEQ